jgi:predicted histone-like DNA-binding protein
MSIKFKSVTKKDPRDLEAAPLYYASSVVSNRIDIDGLSRAIARSSTVARADIYAVIVALIDEITENLTASNLVSLGKLGSFAVNVHSEGAPTSEELSSANIKGAKIIYRPGAEIKDMLKTLKYEKVN